MSHYTCAVFAEQPGDFRRLLAPYSETDETYFRFDAVSESEFDRLKAQYTKFISENFDSSSSYSFEEWLESYACLENRNGVWGNYYNPDAKWDWYDIDGKDYIFSLKSGHDFDEDGWFKKSDVDFALSDEEDTTRAENFWHAYVLNERPDLYDSVDNFPLYKREYYLERYGTLEQYIKETGHTVPYAFITPDGKWHSPGNMGWFALDDSTSDSWNAYYEEWKDFIDNAPDCYMTVADLHI